MFKVYLQNSIIVFGLSIDLEKKLKKILILAINSYKILTIQKFINRNCFTLLAMIDYRPSQ